MMKINKYKIMLVINIGVILICIYSGLTGNIAFLQKYFITKRTYRHYMWSNIALIGDVLLIYTISRSYPKLNQLVIKIIVYSILTFIFLIQFYNLFMR